jgi:glycosyltransferase involved in cell wall biosynthesis
MAGADVGLLTNTTAGGDATSVPGKVYEYLALGKPVLCLTEGGAAETLLSRLGAGSLAARIDDPSSIAAALDRLQAGDRPEAGAGNGLARYSRRELASEMAGLLERVSAGG